MMRRYTEEEVMERRDGFGEEYYDADEVEEALKYITSHLDFSNHSRVKELISDAFDS